ncbi:MAG: cysteine sulfinate desulfinase [Marine Group III euryarchaeote CG-Epi3]|jgi:cysteine desulfurase/selenocysteine lyase|uniref:Cysteine desulfurase n=1 Tax=Marine Group III euryarchaeote CG-Epi3 TaxID=1888997 RepID=A0A1J5U3N8_9ARCH|nr:MAG: cysteine sulfinate desulfinase [Marine Group III euryarchaeote CG-Epi3]
MIKDQFPILSKNINNKPLIYLDNASTTQKPLSVIEEIKDYYESTNSNIHRGVHHLSQKATDLYEKSREKIQKFIGAKSSKEIIFVRGATEAVNLVANSYVRALLSEGDNIIISQMEHHANIVPWQIIAKEKKAEIRVIPINDLGELILEEIDSLIDDKTKFVSLNHVSNSLGTVNPIQKLIQKAHENDIRIMIDGAQAVQHMKVDVSLLDVDFYCFSGHKMYGPTGIGILYGKKEILDKMQPYQGGGDMIKSVTFEKTIYNDVPHIFEAGTPNIAGAIGLSKAIEFIEEITLDKIEKHEMDLLNYATEKIRNMEHVKIIGNSEEKASVISFVIEGIHPHDIGTIMDNLGIAIRAGHHCTQPIMDFYEVPATARASFAIYNTKEDVDKLVEGIKKTKEVFA